MWTFASVDQALRLQVSLPDPQTSATGSHSELSYHCILYLKAGFIRLHSPTYRHAYFLSCILPLRFPHCSLLLRVIRLANSILLNIFNCASIAHPENRSSAAQDITRNFQYRVHYSPPISLFWARLIQFMDFQFIGFKIHFISYSLLRLGLSSGLFPSDFTPNLCMHFSTTRAKVFVHLISLDMITRRIPAEECKPLNSSSQSSAVPLFPSSEAQVRSPSVRSH